MNCLSGRQQYVQIDDKRSGKLNTNFCVPQGSILGPVLFNLYVADLADHLVEGWSCHQYADDTTIYNSVKPKDLQKGVTKISDSLKNLVHWSDESKLAINNDKTKTMVVTTPQMTNYHFLQTPGIINISLNNNKNLEVLETYKLLGVHFGNTLRWEKHVNETVSSCYACLAILRKLRNMAPFQLGKQSNNIEYSIKWRTLKRAKPYNPASKSCNLCLLEKYFIIFKPEMTSLNKRNELVSSCRHANKFLLKAFK